MPRSIRAECKSGQLIHRQVEQIPEVLECVVVERHSTLQTGESRMVLFVKLRPGLWRSRTSCSGYWPESAAYPRQSAPVPERRLAVHDIPRTLSGKISEWSGKLCMGGPATLKYGQPQ